MTVCTCPCPLHSSESVFDVDAFWSSVTGGSPRLDNSPARLVLMGDGRVGTSSLIKRFTRGQFDVDYKPEVAKVMRHTKTVFTSRLNANVTVQFWDIEGSDVKTSLLCAQKAHAVGVVYDITNRSSFELAQRLLDGVNPRASVILIANKIDLNEQRKVSRQEGRLLSKIHRVEYLEVSAKLGRKVDETFSIIINSVPEVYLRSGSRESSSIAAARRWKVSTALVCTACSAKIKGKNDDEPPLERSKVREKSRVSESESEATRRPGFSDSEATRRPRFSDSEATRRPRFSDSEATRRPRFSDSEATRRPRFSDRQPASDSERFRSSDPARGLTGRRRVRSDADYDQSVMEKAISI